MTETTDDLRFDDALEELEEIVDAIESDEIALDDLAERVDRAAELVEFCRSRIEKTEMRVQTIIDGMQSGEDA